MVAFPAKLLVPLAEQVRLPSTDSVVDRLPLPALPGRASAIDRASGAKLAPDCSRLPAVRGRPLSVLPVPHH